jgi:hypothetical protein
MDWSTLTPAPQATLPKDGDWWLPPYPYLPLAAEKQIRVLRLQFRTIDGRYSAPPPEWDGSLLGLMHLPPLYLILVELVIEPPPSEEK